MIDLDAAEIRTRDVCSLASVTPRQLQVWDENHVLVPVHHGKIRHYTIVQAVMAMVGRELRARHFSTVYVRRIVKLSENAARHAIASQQRWIVMVPYKTGGGGYVQHRAEMMRPDDVVAWMKIHGGCFAIAIHDLVDELAARMAKLRMPAAKELLAGRRQPAQIPLAFPGPRSPGATPGNQHR